MTPLFEMDFSNHPHVIRTASGKYLDVTDPKSEDIELVDIARGLAHQPRWGGQTPFHFSVAQHSVLCYQLMVMEMTWKVLSESPINPSAAILLHDASEAYLCDIPRPIKSLLKGYEEIEQRLMEVIYDKYDVKMNGAINDMVKFYDDVALELEWWVLLMDQSLDTFISLKGWEGDVSFLRHLLSPMQPEEAELILMEKLRMVLFPWEGKYFAGTDPYTKDVESTTDSRTFRRMYLGESGDSTMEQLPPPKTPGIGRKPITITLDKKWWWGNISIDEEE